MTLAELLPTVHQLRPSDKLRLIRYLAEDLDSLEDIAPLEANKVDELPTPYDTFGAGRMLMEAMAAAPSEEP